MLFFTRRSRFLLVSALAAGTFVNTLRAAPATNHTASGSASNSFAITVTARKSPEPLQEVPGAVTVRSAVDLASAGARDLRDAASGTPNLTLADFSSRQLTFPYVRGIGSGQNDPGVATYIDGVPQLSYITANQELLDADRVEFLRGPQGALYGNGALGGVINIVPRLPSATPGGSVSLTAGSHGLFDSRVSATGPLGGGLLGSFSGGFATRDGYTKNDVTGHNLDSQQAWFGHAQLYLPNQGDWDFRLSVTGESDRDGDYALYDLANLRANPYHASHDYEGCNDRDLLQPVFTARRHGDAVEFTSITALQWWRTHSRTDLDYTALDLMRQRVDAISVAGTEELRLASPVDAPVALTDRLNLHWLAGAFFFASRTQRETLTDYRPGGVAPPPFGWLFPYQEEKDSCQHDLGASLFGQTTLTLDKAWELTLGLRDDFEHRAAKLASQATAFFIPPTASTPERDFNQVCPDVSLAYHFTPDFLAYVKVSEGYRAGGFNAEGPASYNPETSWNYEAGLKTLWFDRQLIANAALFRTVWHDMQLNVPVGSNPYNYCVENAGRARSQGAELELRATPCRDLELFAGGALLDADFRPGSQTLTGTPPYTTLNIGGNDLPFAPHVTWNAGAQLSRDLPCNLRGFVRTDVTGMTRSFFDPSNGASQGALALVNLRFGVEAGNWRAELWAKNLFDRRYIAMALPYGVNYIGENGAPRTLGMTLTRAF